MTMDILWAAAAAALLLAGAAVWFRRRAALPNARLRKLAGRALRGGGEQPVAGDAAGVLKDAHALFFDLLSQPEPAPAFQAVDVLKTAYGSGWARPDETGSIGLLYAEALRTGKADLAGAVLDLYRPLLRRRPAEQKNVAEQLAVAAARAARARHTFLIAKSADLLFEMLEQCRAYQDTDTAGSLAKALGTVGLAALRRDDMDLFRETIVRFSAFLADRPGESAAVLWSGPLESWFDRVARGSDTTAFDLLAQLSLELFERPDCPADAADRLMSVWQSAAGAAAVNPYSPMAFRLVGLLLDAGMRTGDQARWTRAVNGASQAARIAVTRLSFHEAFPVLFPLLDCGRRLMIDTLKFDGMGLEGFRGRALFTVVRELRDLVNHAARISRVDSPGSVIAQIDELWRGFPEAGATGKTARRFCQLLYITWLRSIRNRGPKTMQADHGLAEPPFSPVECERLAFLDGWSGYVGGKR